MRKKLDGGCFCGAVRYRLTIPPLFVHCCHCTECQNQTGSAFVINALYETERIELLRGSPQRVPMSAPGDAPHDIYRCRKCKVAVWSDYGRRPQFRFVRVGTLDQPKRLAPDVHIFTRSKQPWVALPRGTPAFKVYYDMQKLWPKKSLERRKAALEPRP
jgi:hypothetical protein